MNLRQLQCFQLIAKYLNFTKAASELFITQSGASQQIQALEEELGIKLFDRSSKRVRLTEAGTRLQKNIDEPLSALLKGIQDVQQFSTNLPRKKLVIGCYAVTKERFVASFVRKFAKGELGPFPTVLRMQPAQLLDALHKGDVDIALLSPEDIDWDEKSVRFFPLHEIKLVCILSRTHPLASQKELTAAKLKGCTIVIPPQSNCQWRTYQYIRNLVLTELENVQIIESPDGGVTDIMLASSHAVTIRPDYAAVVDETLWSIPLQCSYKMSYGVAILRTNIQMGKQLSSMLSQEDSD